MSDYNEQQLREMDARIAEKVMGWPVVPYVGWVLRQGPFVAREGGLVEVQGGENDRWSPSTDIAADYSVLIQVRETWNASERQDFENELVAIWRMRAEQAKSPNCEMLYKPGDYSLAALACLDKEKPRA
jgi:hypothetical protein